MSPRPKPKAPEDAVETPTEFEVLEAAAARVLDAMPTQGPRDVLRETATAQHIPLWMLVCGLLQRCYDSGEYTAPVLDPLWLHDNPVTMGGYAEATCATCLETFRPRWPGQEYCCGLCGATGARNRTAADRAAHVVELHNYPVGQEPEGRARSTIRQHEASGVGEEADKLGGVPGREVDPITDIDSQAQASIRVA